MEWNTITPAQAREMLWRDRQAMGAGGRQSPLIRVIEQYAGDMRGGRWEPVRAGEHIDPITLGKDGMIINGYHRLLACVAAGVPFETFVEQTKEALTPIKHVGKPLRRVSSRAK